MKVKTKFTLAFVVRFSMELELGGAVVVHTKYFFVSFSMDKLNTHSIYNICELWHTRCPFQEICIHAG